MAVKTQYLEYTIHLTNKATVAARQAEFPNGLRTAPEKAAVTYAAPVQIKSAEFKPPCTRSVYFTFPVILPSTLTNYPRHLDSFTRKSGGWFGLSFLFGDTTTFIWVGKFAYAPDATGDINDVPTEVVAMAKVKWFIGFETYHTAGELAEINNAGGSSSRHIRDASRHADGAGWYSSTAGEIIASPTQSGEAGSQQAWERFYFKMVQAPAAPTRMHRFKLTVGASRGAAIYMTPDRRFQYNNISDAGAETLMASSTTQFDVGRWYRIDLLLQVANNAGFVKVYIDGKLEMTANGPATLIGISAGGTHESSMLGPGGGGTGTFRCYYDDWRCAAWPIPDSQGRYVGIDWLNGTRVIAVPATAFATGNNFLGDYRFANQYRLAGNVPAGSILTSNVSGDALRLLMDSEYVKSIPGSIGPINFLVAVRGRNQVSGQGTLGWKYDGVTDLAAQVYHPGGTAEGGNTTAWFRRWFRPAAATVPIPMSGAGSLIPFELHKVKALDANLAEYYGAVWLVELVGVFGNEDVNQDQTNKPSVLPARRGLHNSPYPLTPWARNTIAPTSPVVVHSGTYTGNGTAQELVFRVPVGFIMIRRVPDSGKGTWWFSSLLGGHEGGELGTASGNPVEVRIDPNFVPVDAEDQQEIRCVVRVVGSGTFVNQNTVVYQYVAFMDPGSRYHINGAYHMNSAQHTPGPVNVPLDHTTFLAEWVKFQEEVPGGGPAVARAIKGPGHAANQATMMDGTNKANGATITAGNLAILNDLMNTGDGRVMGYSAWRDDDLSTDAKRHDVVKIGSYVGDGTASRTINFGTSGKRPLYVQVTPSNAVSYHRDPSHLTNTSTDTSTGLSQTTAITGGGIDSFTVGALLNVNATIYNYFVLIGSATAGNGGWSIDGEFSVVEPDSPANGNWQDGGLSVVPPVAADPDPDPGTDDDDDCAAGSVCVAATTRIVNLALLEIGSVQVLTNYCTQQTKEAKIAQEVYEQCVRHTLITYPWPFATKYAVLALTATQPSNQDWVYSYRMPTDCIFPRRIVVARGSAIDPSPPPMGLSSDSTGGIILTNEQNATLEYTARPGCVGFNGDDLFREALKWRLAAALAPPLTRIPGEADRCLKMFEIIVQKAESVVKQGVPGLRPSASALDTTQAALDANVQVVNMALVRIGSRTIRNLSSEQSREAVASALVFEDTLRSVLRDHPWAFATRYVDPLTLVGGTEGNPITPDWTYSHRLPTDLVYLRRVVLEGTGRSFDPEPFPFRLASDTTGGLLYSNQALPVIEYTARLQNILTYADPLFREALSWKLAATLAPSLASVELHRPEQHGRGPETPQDPTRRTAQRFTDQSRRINVAQWANAMYQRALLEAAAADRNEAQPEPDGLPDWLRARS